MTNNQNKTIHVKTTKPKKADPFSLVLCLILGIVIFCFGCFGCINMEKMVTKDNKITNYIEKNAITITNLNPQNDGKLVLYNAIAETDEILSDDTISINAISLKRFVEEKVTKKKSVTKGTKSYDGKNYTTTTTWEELKRDDKISKGSKKFYAQDVTFGEFTLTQNVIKDFTPTQRILELPQHPTYQTQIGYYNIYRGISPSFPSTKSHEPSRRISYYYSPTNTDYTIIAKQDGNTLSSLFIDDIEVVSVHQGNLSLEDVIKSRTFGNTLITFFQRILLFFVFYLALFLIFTGIGLNGCIIGLIAALPAEILVIMLANSL